MLEDDSGTTLTEVLVVMAISTLIVPALYLAMMSGFGRERSQEANLLAEAELRMAVELLREDIRSSWSSEQMRSTPSQSLNLEHISEAGASTWIVWYLDGSSLIRVVADADSGTALFNEEMIGDLAVEDVFRYWSNQGVEIEDNLASCAARVTVDLRQVTDDADVDTTFDVAYRLRNPEVEPC